MQIAVGKTQDPAGREPFRKLIPPRSRDQQPFLRPRHSDIKEFHVLRSLGFRGFDLAEADEDYGANQGCKVLAESTQSTFKPVSPMIADHHIGIGDGKQRLVVEVIRLLDVADACEKSLLRELIDKPKMRAWVGLHEPEPRDRLLAR